MNFLSSEISQGDDRTHATLILFWERGVIAKADLIFSGSQKEKGGKIYLSRKRIFRWLIRSLILYLVQAMRRKTLKSRRFEKKKCVRTFYSVYHTPREGSVTYSLVKNYNTVKCKE